MMRSKMYLQKQKVTTVKKKQKLRVIINLLSKYL